MKTNVRWMGLSLLMALLLLSLSLKTMQTESVTAVSAANNEFNYGFNVVAWDTNKLHEMGFNWMKLFANPDSRQPINIFLRVNANVNDFNDLTTFGNAMATMAQSQRGFVEAYEIGNEPNLDASYGWTESPNAADYAALLCVAYDRIKAIDPDVRIISAGLAPTGRVTNTWGSHAGHNGFYQDEREFLKEFITAGGGDCLDAVGYHPVGFSADYDAEPDVNLGDPTTDCTNGFCFRGVEKIYEIMQARGLGDKTVWATEMGWLAEPPSSCLSDPSWNGRRWQIVSEEKQSANLVGAFQYATDHWAWMEAMFIFNLNFNLAGYPPCEQMSFYAVQNRPAEVALREMIMGSPPKIGELSVGKTAVSAIITPTQQPFTRTTPVHINNSGTAPFTYTLAMDSGTLSATIDSMGGVLQPMETAVFSITITSNGRFTGTYTSTLTIAAVPSSTLGAPVTIPVQLFVVDQIYSTYLPAILRP